MSYVKKINNQESLVTGGGLLPFNKAKTFFLPGDNDNNTKYKGVVGEGGGSVGGRGYRGLILITKISVFGPNMFEL